MPVTAVKQTFLPVMAIVALAETNAFTTAPALTAFAVVVLMPTKPAIMATFTGLTVAARLKECF